jgi:hypothetical protein
MAGVKGCHSSSLTSIIFDGFESPSAMIVLLAGASLRGFPEMVLIRPAGRCQIAAELPTRGIAVFVSVRTARQYWE